MNFGTKGNHQRDREYPGVRGPRPDGKSLRQREALERQAEYDKLSLEQKLERHERKLAGGNLGEGKRQRARLLKLIEGQKVQASAKAENQIQKFIAKQAASKKS
jgi:hypothetical protein